MVVIFSHHWHYRFDGHGDQSVQSQGYLTPEHKGNVKKKKALKTPQTASQSRRRSSKGREEKRVEQASSNLHCHI